MVKKVVIVMIIFQIMFIPISNAFSLDSIINSGKQFLQDGQANSDNILSGENEQNLKDMTGQIYNILFGIGVGLSVIIGAILGIKYMTGTIEDQAKIKETLIPYIIGCIVVFGAFGIWKIVITIGGKVF